MANNPKLEEVSKDTQFKPGQSGNPEGKPKGTKHIATHIQNMLNDDKFTMKLKDGKEFKGRPMEAVIKTAIIQAVSGDGNAREWLAKHGYGTNINIKVDNPIEALLEEFGVRKAIEDDRKIIEAVPDSRKKPA